MLGLRDNDVVEWRFVHRGYIPFPRLAARAASAVSAVSAVSDR